MAAESAALTDYRVMSACGGEVDVYVIANDNISGDHCVAANDDAATQYTAGANRRGRVDKVDELAAAVGDPLCDRKFRLRIANGDYKAVLRLGHVIDDVSQHAVLKAVRAQNRGRSLRIVIE